jgi:hypothetical protein
VLNDTVQDTSNTEALDLEKDGKIEVDVEGVGSGKVEIEKDLIKIEKRLVTGAVPVGVLNDTVQDTSNTEGRFNNVGGVLADSPRTCARSCLLTLRRTARLRSMLRGLGLARLRSRSTSRSAQ